MRTELSPGFPPANQRCQFIIDWWTELEMSGDAGCSSWEVLDRIRDEVTYCIGCDPPNLGKAEGLTAKAMHLVSDESD